VVAAVAFVSCGFFTGHGQHTAFVLAYATLPWFVWRLDRAVAGRSIAAALQAGAIWGLVGLSGYPGMVVAHGLYGGAWALGRILFGGLSGPLEPAAEATDRRSVAWRPRLRWSAVLGLCVLLTALVVMAPTYTAFFLEGQEFTSRVAPLSRYWVLERGALHPSALKTFASPYMIRWGFANPRTLFEGDISMVGIYLSPVVLALAIVSVFGARRSRWRWWLLGVGIIAFAAAMGSVLPVRGWLHDLVPPTRYFRFSALFRGYALFTAVALALEGARDAEWVRSRRAWATLAAGSAAVGCLALWTLGRAAAETAVAREWDGWTGWSLLAWLGPLVVALTGTFGGVRARQAAPWLLTALAVVDAAGSLRLFDRVIATRNPVQLEIWEQVTQEHNPMVDRLPYGLDRTARVPWGRGNDNRNLATKRATFNAYDPFRNRYHVAWLENPGLIALATGTDRFWFAPQALLVDEIPPPPGAGEPKLLDIPTPDLDRFAHRAIAVRALLPALQRVPGRRLDGPVTRRGSVEDLEAMERIPVTLLEASPETLEIRVRAPGPGWLVVTDRYSPGWRATVDGRPAPVHKAAFLFRAVALEGGTHEVRFEFRPFLYRTQVTASWSLLLVAGLAGLPSRRR
jgi:hypothetical protein